MAEYVYVYCFFRENIIHAQAKKSSYRGKNTQSKSIFVAAVAVPAKPGKWLYAGGCVSLRQRRQAATLAGLGDIVTRAFVYLHFGFT